MHFPTFASFLIATALPAIASNVTPEPSSYGYDIAARDVAAPSDFAALAARAVADFSDDELAQLAAHLVEDEVSTAMMQRRSLLNGITSEKLAAIFAAADSRGGNKAPLSRRHGYGNGSGRGHGEGGENGRWRGKGGKGNNHHHHKKGKGGRNKATPVSSQPDSAAPTEVVQTQETQTTQETTTQQDVQVERRGLDDFEAADADDVEIDEADDEDGSSAIAIEKRHGHGHGHEGEGEGGGHRHHGNGGWKGGKGHGGRGRHGRHGRHGKGKKNGGQEQAAPTSVVAADGAAPTTLPAETEVQQTTTTEQQGAGAGEGEGVETTGTGTLA